MNYNRQMYDYKINSMAECPTSILRGTVKNLTITPTGGTPPYRYDLLVDGVIVQTFGGKTQPQDFTFSFDQSPGTHVYEAKITDSCTNPSPKVSTTSCIINITSGGGCVPIWQCEKPLNGYESDGCGTRRTNSTCNPVVKPPVVCPDGQINIAGQCVPKNYVVYGGIGIGIIALLLMSS